MENFQKQKILHNFVTYKYENKFGDQKKRAIDKLHFTLISSANRYILPTLPLSNNHKIRDENAYELFYPLWESYCKPNVEQLNKTEDLKVKTSKNYERGKDPLLCNCFGRLFLRSILVLLQENLSHYQLTREMSHFSTTFFNDLAYELENHFSLIYSDHFDDSYLQIKRIQEKLEKEQAEKEESLSKNQSYVPNHLPLKRKRDHLRELGADFSSLHPHSRDSSPNPDDPFNDPPSSGSESDMDSDSDSEKKQSNINITNGNTNSNSNTLSNINININTNSSSNHNINTSNANGNTTTTSNNSNSSNTSISSVFAKNKKQKRTSTQGGGGKKPNAKGNGNLQISVSTIKSEKNMPIDELNIPPRDLKAKNEAIIGMITSRVIYNDDSPENLVLLIHIRNIFSRQVLFPIPLAYFPLSFFLSCRFLPLPSFFPPSPLPS